MGYSGGKLYSGNFTTSAGADLTTQIETALGVSSMVIKKITIISSADLHLDFNDTGVYSTLYLDSVDSKYKLSTGLGDILISSIKTQEGSVSVWVDCIY